MLQHAQTHTLKRLSAQAYTCMYVYKNALTCILENSTTHSICACVY